MADAESTDVEAVELDVLQQASEYFRDTLNKSPAHVRPVPERLAHDAPVELERRTQRWLQRRCLLTADDRLAIPVLGRWVRECWEG